MLAGDTPPCLWLASLSEGRLPHQQVVVLDVDFMNDSLAETPEDKHGSEADHVNPDSRNGRRGGAQVRHVSPKSQDSEHHYEPNPLPRLSKPAVRLERLFLHLHAVTRLRLRH